MNFCFSYVLPASIVSFAQTALRISFISEIVLPSGYQIKMENNRAANADN